MDLKISALAVKCTHLSIHPARNMHSSRLALLCKLSFFGLSSPAPIYCPSLEVYTNCGTKVPLGNGLSRNADLGTATGTGPTHGHSLISFGLN